MYDKYHAVHMCMVAVALPISIVIFRFIINTDDSYSMHVPFIHGIDRHLISFTHAPRFELLLAQLERMLDGSSYSIHLHWRIWAVLILHISPEQAEDFQGSNFYGMLKISPRNKHNCTEYNWLDCVHL